ncbi:LuxR C-terminal-related transcriptional regulator [Paenibacillus filicis]|uniref:LuxR C-terminal-related transcriptional regulator n=1 Tax=Paenibacillus filicis TaxID=669464 RepID=A0ABU9DEW6_9BACL
MSTPILSTKLFIPRSRSKVVARPRLIERLNEGIDRRLTVIAASAGFGKTTLASEWLAQCHRPAAWVSLDEGDNDPARFLTYLVAALQQIGSVRDEGVWALLRSPQPPPIESILTALLHEICAVPDPFLLVLDDYHEIKAEAIDKAVALLLERMPPQMHLVITTREKPRLPVARMRVRDQVTEVGAADLRFTYPEAAEFLGRAMGLSLLPADIALLEARTEGWITGLQLAALSIKEQPDASGFIQSFAGSDRFVLDYLMEEVVGRQSEGIQSFLLQTSILDRLCGPLCEAVMGRDSGERLVGFGIGAGSGQEALELLEQAHLFIVPLDNERRWYRYHHLFAGLLRQRLRHSLDLTTGEGEQGVAELHARASKWYEGQGQELEAFHHAAAALDIPRAARLVEGAGVPLHFRGALAPVLSWLDSLPTEEWQARPALQVIYASGRLMLGQTAGLEQSLQAAELSLQATERDDKTRDLLGHLAAIRATLAVSRHQAEIILAESRRALACLHPDNLPVRTAITWSMGYAYQLQGNRAAAGQAYAEALTISQRIGHVIITMMATLGLGLIQEGGLQLHAAAETYRRVLKLAGDPPLPAACEAYLGLARISYAWNDLPAAEGYARLSIQLAEQLEQIDRAVAGEVFMARLELTQGNVSGAAARIAQADYVTRQQNFANQFRPIADVRAQVLLCQGNLAAAAHLTEKYDLPLASARIYLAQADPSAALTAVEPVLRQAETNEWRDERLQAMALRVVALHAHGETAEAAQVLRDVLAQADPGGLIRIFLDEGAPMYRALGEALTNGSMPDYLKKVLAAFEAAEPKDEIASGGRPPQPAQPRTGSRTESILDSLIEPLSERELEVLNLIAQGLSNREISERLFIALTTVKGHNRIIFDKLQVKRRTEAVARARNLGLL